MQGAKLPKFQFVATKFHESPKFSTLMREESRLIQITIAFYTPSTNDLEDHRLWLFCSHHSHKESSVVCDTYLSTAVEQELPSTSGLSSNFCKKPVETHHP